MIIKSKKARSKNILYLSAEFTPEEIENNRKFCCELKCHLIDSPEPYGTSTEYVLHDLQLDNTADEGWIINLRYKHRDDSTQILVFSVIFPPVNDFVIYYILLHCGQSDAKDSEFRNNACNSVKEILEKILNRKPGLHCSTCIHKFKQRLTDKCGEFYEFNKLQHPTE